MKQHVAALIIALSTVFPCIAQENIPALIPYPNSIELLNSGKSFRFTPSTKICTTLPENAFAVRELQRITGKHLAIIPEKSIRCRRNAIFIDIDSTLDGREHYVLNVDKRGIHIKGATEGALFLALQTFDQLLQSEARNMEIPFIRIDDKPRYNFRAIMLDPARHFLPAEDIKLFIDQMARFKFNVLQLHLTDDQGWRIEIKSHPELTAKGAFRNPQGNNQGPDNGYYTQEEIKEIIAYAADRNIEVIPELDIPGHSVAILTAHPQLGCVSRQKDAKQLGSTTNMMLCAANNDVYSIYNAIITEVAALFPSKYIHLGGDEAAVKENWAKCPDCTKMMERHGYEKPSQLMIPFFGKILEAVRANGKEAILWCELDNMWPPASDYLFPYPADVTLVTWRNALTPKCIELTRKHGHKLIMAPGEHAYLDYPQYPGDLPEFNNWGMPVTTLEQSYRLDPGYALAANEQAHIQGVMATLWAEAIKDINRVTYMAFPRAMAIAEAGWSNMTQRNWESFKQRIYPNITGMMKDGISVRIPFEIVTRERK